MTEKRARIIYRLGNSVAVAKAGRRLGIGISSDSKSRSSVDERVASRSGCAPPSAGSFEQNKPSPDAFRHLVPMSLAHE